MDRLNPITLNLTLNELDILIAGMYFSRDSWPPNTKPKVETLYERLTALARIAGGL